MSVVLANPKSLQRFPKIKFSNAYKDKTNYTDIGLELHRRAYVVSLHPSGIARLINVCKFAQGFLEGICRLRLTAKALAVMAKSLVQFRVKVF